MKRIKKTVACIFVICLVAGLAACSPAMILEPLSKGLESSSSSDIESTEESTEEISSEAGNVSGTEEGHVHSWDEGTETKAATCFEEGEMLYTCTCTKTKTEPIAKLVHNWEDGVCSNCGEPAEEN